MDIETASRSADGEVKRSSDPFPVGGWSPEPVALVPMRRCGELNMAMTMNAATATLPDGKTVHVMQSLTDAGVRLWIDGPDGETLAHFGVTGKQLVDAALEAFEAHGADPWKETDGG